MGNGHDSNSMVKAIVSGVAVAVIAPVVLYMIGIKADGDRRHPNEDNRPVLAKDARSGGEEVGEPHRAGPAAAVDPLASGQKGTPKSAQGERNVKSVAGAGLAAGSISEAEESKRSTEMLKGSLAALPPLLTGAVSGEPEYDRAKSEAIFRIVIQPDRAAFLSYRERFEEALKSIALHMESTTIKGEPVDHSPDLRWNRDVAALAGPPLSRLPKDTWCIWVNASNDELHSRTRWNCYVVTADLAESMAPLLGETKIGLKLLDSERRTVAEDELPLPIDEELAFRFGSRPGDTDNYLPLLRRLVIRLADGSEVWEGINAGRLNRFLEERADHRQAYIAQATANLYVAPYAFTIKRTGYGTTLYYSPSIEVKHRLGLSPGELKRVDRAEVSIHFKRNGSDKEL